MSFDKTFDPTAGVYFHFYNISDALVHTSPVILSASVRPEENLRARDSARRHNEHILQACAIGTPADPRVAYVRRNVSTQGTCTYYKRIMRTRQDRDTRTHSSMYVHGIDAPQKNKMNQNRAMVYFPTESGVGHVRKR